MESIRQYFRSELEMGGWGLIALYALLPVSIVLVLLYALN